MRTALVLVLACAACGGKGEEKQASPPADPARPATPGSAAPPAGLTKVSVKFSGKPVAMQRAFVKRMDPDRYQIYLTSHGGSCRELLDNLFGSGDRIDVLLNVTPRLNADGKPYLQITDVFEGSPTMVIGPGAKAAITGAAAKGEPAQVALDFSAAAKEPEAGGLTIEVRGSFTAEGCGVRDPDPTGMPRVPHPTSAAITFANQRLELKGAIVRGGGKTPDLLLSTRPKDCSGATPPAPVILERVGGRWRASGTWLEQPAQAAGKPTLAAALGATGKSDDGPTVQLALSGAGDLGGYQVALEGTIEAIACK